MKNYILLMALSLVALSFQAKAQLADGVYLAQTGTVKNLILIKDHYLSFINYDDINKHFGYTWGGPIRQQSDQISLVTEYDSKDTTQVGKEVNLNYQKKADAILIKLPDSEGQFIKQKNIPQQLDALWRITGRQQEAKMHDIPRSERKTIKILVDGYFQWIAINPAKKGFYGTGGGHYNYSNNRYSEKIQFFSRDNSRVGHELHFNGSLVDNKWHHSGKSSKGDDIYEIWSKETAK